MKVGYLLQVIVGVICDFLCVCYFPKICGLKGCGAGEHHTSLCVALLSMHSEQILLSKPSAVPYTVHMEEIKVRHGAKARNGALVFNMLCFRSNSQGSQYFGKKGQEIPWCLLMIKNYFFKNMSGTV